MVLNERQKKIIELVRAAKHISVKKLASELYVSEMTVRRDLKLLETSGYIHRYNGGATSAHEYDELPLESRLHFNTKEKKQLCENAAKYLHDGITVFIDSSSTCEYIIPLLAEYRDVRLITNSIKCLLEAARQGIPCVIIGGGYYENDMCTIGGDAVDFISRYNIDVAFLTSRGVDEAGNVSDSNDAQTAVRRAVIRRSRETVLLFDSSKLGKRYIYSLINSKELTQNIHIYIIGCNLKACSDEI